MHTINLENLHGDKHTTIQGKKLTACGLMGCRTGMHGTEVCEKIILELICRYNNDNNYTH